VEVGFCVRGEGEGSTAALAQHGEGTREEEGEAAVERLRVLVQATNEARGLPAGGRGEGDPNEIDLDEEEEEEEEGEVDGGEEEAAVAAEARQLWRDAPPYLHIGSNQPLEEAGGETEIRILGTLNPNPTAL